MSARAAGAQPCQAAPSISTASIDSSQAASSTKVLAPTVTRRCCTNVRHAGGPQDLEAPQISSSLWQPSASSRDQRAELGPSRHRRAPGQLVPEVPRAAHPTTDGGDRGRPEPRGPTQRVSPGVHKGPLHGLVIGSPSTRRRSAYALRPVHDHARRASTALGTDRR